MNVTLINLVFVYIAWQIKFVSRGSVLLTILTSPFFFYYPRSNFGWAFHNISIKLKPSLHPAPIPVHFKQARLAVPKAGEGETCLSHCLGHGNSEKAQAPSPAGMARAVPWGDWGVTLQVTHELVATGRGEWAVVKMVSSSCVWWVTGCRMGRFGNDASICVCGFSREMCCILHPG